MSNILLVTLGVQGPIKSGGISTAFYNLARFLKSSPESDSIDILYGLHPYYQDKNEEYWMEEYNKIGINFIGLKNVNREFYGTLDMKRSYCIYEYLKECSKDYDKIIFHDYKGVAYYTLQAKYLGLEFSNIELVVSAHGNTRLSNEFNNRHPQTTADLVTYYMEQKTVELADLVISPSQFYFDWYKKSGYHLNNQKVIQNLLSIQSDLQKIEKDSSNSDVFHLCFFARVEPLKGVFVFLDAISKVLQSKQFNIKVSIVGNATQYNGSSIDKIIEPVLSNLDCETHWHKNFNTFEAIEYIKKNNCVVINATLGETSSYTVMEAIEYGIPFIASDIAGIRELVQSAHHELHLFETGNADDLANKILLYHKKRGGGLPELEISQESTKNLWKETMFNNVLPNIPSSTQTIDGLDISVIMPTTGNRDVIFDTLQGFLNSSIKPLEILIGIDGNENECVTEIVSTLPESFRDIIHIYHFNQSYKPGVANQLVQKAKGQYLLFFDDDDIPFEYMIARYLRVLNHNLEIDLLSDFAQNFEENKEGENVDWNRNPVTLKNVSGAIGNAKSVNVIMNYFGKANFIVKKSVYEAVGGFTITKKLSPYVDWDFFTKCSAQGYQIETIPEPLYYYRMHSSGSIYYNSHGNNEFEGVSKRYFGQEKISNAVILSENIRDYQDYFTYTRSLVALPKIYTEPTSPKNTASSAQEKFLKAAQLEVCKEKIEISNLQKEVVLQKQTITKLSPENSKQREEINNLLDKVTHQNNEISVTQKELKDLKEYKKQRSAVPWKVVQFFNLLKGRTQYNK